jgi:predicted metal-dependent hydrolase
VSLPDINLLNISKDIVEELQVKTKLFDDISQTSDIYKNTKVIDAVIPPALSKEKVEALLDKVETTILKIKDIETIKSTLTATDEETNKLTEQTEKLCSEKTKIQSEFKDSNRDLICPHSGDVYADECLVRFCK